MASKRALLAFPLRSASCIRARPQFLISLRTTASQASPFKPAPKQLSQIRCYSAPPAEKNKTYAFEDVKALVEKPDEDIVLIGM
jgi:hypothetical protein